MASSEIKLHGQNILEKVASYLGEHKAVDRSVDQSTPLIWLLDNTASQGISRSGFEDNNWEAEFVAAYFQNRSGKSESDLLAEITTKLGLTKGHEAESDIKKRLVPLLNEILPAHTVDIRIGGQIKSTQSDVSSISIPVRSTGFVEDDDSVFVKTLGPSNSNGISKNIIKFQGVKYKDGAVIDSTIIGKTPCVTAHTTFAARTGWAVISDIDDTIKRTLTSSVTGILKTTFVDTPEPITGMPEFYEHMKQVLKNPPFWYLSASPYNLYPFLHAFRDSWYPAGTMLLRDSSWQNVAGFLASLTVNTKDYKAANMTAIHAVFPERKFICIGDSTQSDPEAYGQMYNKYPGWIRAIFIRKVSHVSEVTDIIPGESEQQRNSDERFEKAFQGIPREIWKIFTKPSELYESLAEVVRYN